MKRLSQGARTLILLFCVGVSLLSGCSAQKDIDNKADFLDFYSDVFDKYIFHTSENTEMYVVSLKKETAVNNPRVVLSLVVGISDDELTYQWLQKSPDERKPILRECAEFVIEYARNKGWKNDYYLYIVVDEAGNTDSGIDIVYDYENDVIWVPDAEENYIGMFERFNTFSMSEIAETQEGKDFLVENDFAAIKHNEIEYNRGTNSFTVYINQNGEFHTSGENKSTRY